MIMLCGSPHADGNSKYMLDRMNDFFSERSDIFNAVISPEISRGALIAALKNGEAVVLSFPLYADSLPANFLKFLHEAEEEAVKTESVSVVYAIINNGFYDAEQNSIAIRVINSWCEKCSLSFGGAIAIGGGGMFRAAPFGKGPMAKAAKALEGFAESVKNKKTVKNIYTRPSFPRFLYRIAGNAGMKSDAKKNGLSAKDVISGFR